MKTPREAIGRETTMTFLRIILVGALLAGGVLGLAACKEGGSPPPSQDWPPRRTSGGHD